MSAAPRKRKSGQPPEPTRPVNEVLGLEAFQAAPESDGLSLEELTSAYADLLNRGDDPYSNVPPPAEEPPAQALIEESVLAEDSAIQAACEVSPRSILEAMLFVGGPNNESLSARQVASLMRGVGVHEVEAFVQELNQLYDAEGCPYQIVSADVGYRLVLRDEFARMGLRLQGKQRGARLSPAAIDVLAVVAYQQPVTRGEIERLRGKPSGSLLNQLVRRQLLRIERDQQQVAAEHVKYYTTDRFLTCFGLGSLDELPQSMDLETPQ